MRSADSEARVVVDDRKRLPGRGAWLHRSDECLSQALRRRAFGVALRARDAVVRPEDLAETIGGIRHEGSAGSQDR
ncbi:YlxR family protein [Gordonia shandongensis]|uniref:YlxR family protein n=1 Tax=Gordonia shandongensis TaxID=376351 RepID=UPI001FDFFFFD